MDRIPSFSIDHNKLIPGIYISRIDNINGKNIYTYDVRFIRPNREQVMDTGTVHALEHLIATYIRNDDFFKDRIVYFGPMGCRTGFYLIISGESSYVDLRQLLLDALNYVIHFTGKIPGASPIECGNYTDMNLNGAKKYSEKFLNEVIIPFQNKDFSY